VSTSAAVTFAVTKGAPFVILGVNSSSVKTGEPVGVHTVVAGFGTAAATGTIQFTDNGAPVGPVVSLESGGFFGTQAQAAALLTFATAGTHQIGANYNGSSDPNYASVNGGDPSNEITPLPAVVVSGSSGVRRRCLL
jgi:hypothetical protein